MIIGSQDDLYFLWNAIRFANGIHAQADHDAHKCQSRKIHGQGLKLEKMFQAELEIYKQVLPDSELGKFKLN